MGDRGSAKLGTVTCFVGFYNVSTTLSSRSCPDLGTLDEFLVIKHRNYGREKATLNQMLFFWVFFEVREIDSYMLGRLL